MQLIAVEEYTVHPADVRYHSGIASEVHPVQLLALGTGKVAHRLGGCRGPGPLTRHYPRHDSGLLFALRAELLERLGRDPDARATSALCQCNRPNVNALHPTPTRLAMLSWLAYPLIPIIPVNGICEIPLCAMA